METTDATLTSKQKRRAKKRAAIKATAATSVDSAPVKIAGTVQAVSEPDRKPSIADAPVSKKSKALLRKSNKVDLVAEVATAGGPESEIDPALLADLASLVRECAASNPDTADETNIVSLAESRRLPSKKKTATAIDQNILTEDTQQQPAQKPMKGTVKDKNTSVKDKNSSWNFTVDYNDHFETPLVAYTDILPMLLTLAESLGKPPNELVIYDPYYCQGGMVQMLAGMGFPKVLPREMFFISSTVLIP